MPSHDCCLFEETSLDYSSGNGFRSYLHRQIAYVLDGVLVDITPKDVGIHDQWSTSMQDLAEVIGQMCYTMKLGLQAAGSFIHIQHSTSKSLIP